MARREVGVLQICNNQDTASLTSITRHSHVGAWFGKHNYPTWYPNLGQAVVVLGGIEKAGYEILDVRQYCETKNTRKRLPPPPLDLRWGCPRTFICDSCLPGDIVDAETATFIYDEEIAGRFARECRHLPENVSK